MSLKKLAAAGLALFTLGGFVLAVALTPSLGVLAWLGLGGLVLGSVLMFGVLLWSSHLQQAMLRIQTEGARDMLDGLAKLGSGDGLAETGLATSDQLTRLAASVDEHQAALRRELLQVVDARVLGIHETVRDLRRGGDPS